MVGARPDDGDDGRDRGLRLRALLSFVALPGTVLGVVPFVRNPMISGAVLTLAVWPWPSARGRTRPGPRPSRPST